MNRPRVTALNWKLVAWQSFDAVDMLWRSFKKRQRSDRPDKPGSADTSESSSTDQQAGDSWDQDFVVEGARTVMADYNDLQSFGLLAPKSLGARSHKFRHKHPLCSASNARFPLQSLGFRQ